MKYRTGALILIIIALICTSGCTNPVAAPAMPPSTPEPAVIPTTESRTSTITVSEMALQLTDLPPDYILRERSVMTSPEVTQLTRDLGWNSGYFVTYDRTGRLRSDNTRIHQAISIFPVENMNKVFNLEKVALSGSDYPFTSPNEIPFPAIGDKSIAYRFTDMPEPGQVTYTVIFIKKNIFERITMSGTSTDYETLKDIVQKAAAGIR